MKTVPLPRYFSKLGWESWIRQSPLDLKSLLGLVNPALPSRSINAVAYENAEGQSLMEMRLHFVRDFLTIYIKDDMMWTNASPPKFWEKVTQSNKQ